MISMEPVLKRGYASWDQDVLTDDEYALRIAAVRERLRADGCAALVVVNFSLLGVMVDYADMAYLSGLQSGGLLLVPVDAEPAYIGFGGGRELAFMRSLTWLDHVVSGGTRAFEVLRAELAARGIDGGALAVTGATALAPSVAKRLSDALAGFAQKPYDAVLRELRAVKSARELLATRLTLGVVEDAVAAGVAAFAAGGDNRAAMLEAERVARARKARDVRVLASMNGPELRPWEGRLEGRHGPLRLWVAAQYQGYWAEAAATSPARGATDAARAVAAMVAATRAGVTGGAVAAAGVAALPPAVVVSTLSYGLGGAVGLAHQEGTAIRPDSAERLIEGQLFALRAHVGEGGAASLAATVVRVTSTGAVRLTPLRVSG